MHAALLRASARSRASRARKQNAEVLRRGVPLRESCRTDAKQYEQIHSVWMSWFLGRPFNSGEHRPFEAPCWLELRHGRRFVKYFRLFISGSHEARAASPGAAGTRYTDFDGSLSHGTARVPMDAIRGRLEHSRIQPCFPMSRPLCERRTSGGQVRRCSGVELQRLMCGSDATSSIRRPSRDLPMPLSFQCSRSGTRKE